MGAHQSFLVLGLHRLGNLPHRENSGRAARQDSSSPSTTVGLPGGPTMLPAQVECPRSDSSRV